MSTRGAIALAAACGAIVIALVVETGLGWWTSEPARGTPAKPLLVRTSLLPHPAFFGDLVVAQIDVQIDSGAVDAKSVHVEPSFLPYVPSGAPKVGRSRVGRFETLRYRYSIQCLSDDCLPKPKAPLVVRLKPVVVTATDGGRPLKAAATWPATAILSRLAQKDLSSAAHFRRPAAVSAPSYAVSPGLAANVLTGAAGLFGLLAAALLGRELWRLAERRRRRALVQLTPLEAALAYTREAAERPDPADRRKALELLAKTLESEDAPALADTAQDVAWSEDPPSPNRALELADEVEGATRNGR